MIVNSEQFESMKLLERLALPFKSFKSVFQKGSKFTKFVMVLQCILLCSGPLLFGQIELGLILFALFYGLGFFTGFITYNYARHVLNVNAFTYVVMLVIMLAALALILYSTFKMTVDLADRRNDDEDVKKSFIYNGGKN